MDHTAANSSLSPVALGHNKAMKFALSLAMLAATALFADQKLGKPLVGTEPVPLATVIAQSDRYVGKTVQVKGKVTEVCQMAGCWMNLADNQGHLLRIKVKDGDIVFPKNSVGKTAIAEGLFEKHEMSRAQVVAQAKHEAEESGRKFNPAAVKSGKTIYLIAGSGARILD